MNELLNKMNLQLFAETPSSNSPVHTYNMDMDRRDIDVSKKIFELEPNETPFSVMMGRARRKPVSSQYFYWYDSKLGGWWAQVTANAAVGVTELSVDDASIFRPKDLIRVPATNEMLYVTAIDEAADPNTITVTRGFASTTAVAITEDDWLMRIGNAMEQFSKAPEGRITQPVKGFNYTQILRRPFDQSMTASNESTKTMENERTRLQRVQAIEHRLDLERAMIFGERFEDPSGQRSTMGGLLQFIGGNFVDAQDAFSEDVLEEFCEQLFSYGTEKKILICSRRLGSLINRLAQNRIETTSGEDYYGLRLKKYVSFHGDLVIVPSKTFEKDYGGMGVGLDMDNVFMRPFRDTKLKTNIQANDDDGWRDEYLTEASIEVRLPETHCVLRNAGTMAT